MSKNMSKLYMRKSRVGETSRVLAVEWRNEKCTCGAKSLDFEHHRTDCGFFVFYDTIRKEWENRDEFLP